DMPRGRARFDVPAVPSIRPVPIAKMAGWSNAAAVSASSWAASAIRPVSGRRALVQRKQCDIGSEADRTASARLDNGDYALESPRKSSTPAAVSGDLPRAAVPAGRRRPERLRATVLSEELGLRAMQPPRSVPA